MTTLTQLLKTDRRVGLTRHDRCNVATRTDVLQGSSASERASKDASVHLFEGHATPNCATAPRKLSTPDPQVANPDAFGADPSEFPLFLGGFPPEERPRT